VRLLMIDNYDSFTYNLVQYLGELGADLAVYRNDARPLEELVAEPWAGVVISPGPGRPAAAGVSVPAVRAFGERGVPLLGVCLGHQAIGEAFGGRIGRARRLMSARTPDGEIMGVRHRQLPLEGVQFHPESILTGEGKRLLGNFLARCTGERGS
jgi:anthranilate/para-aminobenzoate synthase component II